MVAIFLVIHVIVCIAAYLLMRTGVLKCSKMVMTLVCFVPVWGAAALVVLGLRTRGKQKIRWEVGVEKLLINEKEHRSILRDEDSLENGVVPLGEALLMNDAGLRRELIMDILYTDPGDYIAQLQDARMNDDTEVVHYAVTALVELQKGYDLKFQALERQMEEHPDDKGLVDEYVKALEQYVGSGLLEGSSLEMYLRRYSGLLGEKISAGDGGEPSIALYCRKIETDLTLGEYGQAYEYIQAVLDRWPWDERGYLLLIRHYAGCRNRDGIQRTLDMLRDKEIYLSPKGRSVVEFWSADGGEGA